MSIYPNLCSEFQNQVQNQSSKNAGNSESVSNSNSSQSTSIGTSASTNLSLYPSLPKPTPTFSHSKSCSNSSTNTRLISSSESAGIQNRPKRPISEPYTRSISSTSSNIPKEIIQAQRLSLQGQGGLGQLTPLTPYEACVQAAKPDQSKKELKKLLKEQKKLEKSKLKKV